jgi:hypothetical protein
VTSIDNNPARDETAPARLERIEEAKAFVAALTPAELDRAYRVIFAGEADPRYPYRWNPNP